MFPIKLKILCHDDLSKQMKDLGIETNFEDLKRTTFVFFYIDYMAQMIRDGVEYTEVIVDDHSYITDTNIEDLYKLFKDGKD
jgi:hypothetical protein